jgi:uncharacterized repeat protein (TIGR03803 family)
MKRFTMLILGLTFVVGALSNPFQLMAQTKTTLFSFPGGDYGSEPESGVIRDRQGNLYGTTYGGTGNAYKLSLAGGQWRETVLHVFGTQQGDGSNPVAGLTPDSKGNFFGTTLFGASNTCGEDLGCGTVFELSPGASGAWTETVLNAFSSDADSAGVPFGGVAVDAQGNVFGTTTGGGNGNCNRYIPGCGSLYELTPGTSGWSIRFLHYFHAFELRPDGGAPMGALLSGPDRSLFGTTTIGGISGANGVMGGTVFEISPSSKGGWNETPLYTFGAYSGDGLAPAGGLIRDAQGNLYGMTLGGGLQNENCVDPPGCGTVFMLSPTSTGWQETMLYQFKGMPDGAFPAYSTLVIDGKGNLYGTTLQGGINNPSCNYGCGTVFELSPFSSGWTETVLYAFQGGVDGSQPSGSLAMDLNGNLYGTTVMGGSQNAGTVYEITP